MKRFVALLAVVCAFAVASSVNAADLYFYTQQAGQAPVAASDVHFVVNTLQGDKIAESADSATFSQDLNEGEFVVTAESASNNFFGQASVEYTDQETMVFVLDENGLHYLPNVHPCAKDCKCGEDCACDENCICKVKNASEKYDPSEANGAYNQEADVVEEATEADNDNRKAVVTSDGNVVVTGDNNVVNVYYMMPYDYSGVNGVPYGAGYGWGGGLATALGVGGLVAGIIALADKDDDASRK